MKWAGALALSLVGACAGSAGTTPTPSTAPQAVVVTMRVADSEDFRVLLTDPADIAVAYDLMNGERESAIPNAVVVRGDPSVNTGYSWHMDPDTFEWADMTIEVCDGLPSDVEGNTITSDRYCPWSAVVISVEPYAETGQDPGRSPNY